MIRVKVSSQPVGRHLCFDLENRPLAYWYDGQTTSEITAFGWKWADEKHVNTMLLRSDGLFSCDDRTVLDERDAYLWFVSELVKAGLTYGHNIRRHDLPILNAGLLRRQLASLPGLLTTDTYKDLPKTSGVSKSLENMAAMYGLPGKKLAMPQPAWEQANRLTKTGMGLARKRVVSDVILQERLRKRLLALGVLKPPREWTP